MVAEVSPNYDSQWAAIGAVAQKLGLGTAETVRNGVRQAEVDAGGRAGKTSEESAELKRLRRENADSAGPTKSSRRPRLSSRPARPALPALVRFIAEHAVEQVEIATLEYVDWFNHRRLFEACGDIPPAELEAAHYRQLAALAEAGHSNP